MSLAFLITLCLYICVFNNFDASNLFVLNVNLFVNSGNALYIGK
jgi:hypothetical protein